MTREIHYILTCIEVSDGDDAVLPLFEIKFYFTPGQREIGPSYDSGGEPAEPAEVEFISATCIDSDGLTLTQAQIDKLACDWMLTEYGREAMVTADGEN